MTKVLVLGGHGMLGSMVARVLGRRIDLDVSAAARASRSAVTDTLPYRQFDVSRDPIGALLDSDRYDWVINAIGVIKPRIDEHEAASIENAIAVNAVFPHRLAAAAAERGQRVVQIATDGVFSGRSGPYDETAPHDALDVYGKTKSLGEVPVANVVHLRCSIIGPEPASPLSLLGWALSAPAGARLRGYTRHRWNGITTLHFAKLCAALIADVEVPSPQHVLPADAVSKAELLELALRAFGREDVTVLSDSEPEPLDRTLTTLDQDANLRLWRGAGYEQPPTIAAMLHELAAEEEAYGHGAA